MGSDRGDPAEIDASACEARGAERRAAVTRESLIILDARRVAFTAARATATAAWATAQTDVAAAWTSLTPLLKELRGRLDQAQWLGLHELWADVADDIAACPGERRWSEPDGGFDDAVAPGDTPEKLTGRIEELRARAAAIDSCFGTLIEEQARRPARASEARRTVEQLAADAAAGAGGPDAVRLYARGLVAAWRLNTVADGFADVDGYLDCLSAALTGLLRAWRAIAGLEGARARRACAAQAAVARCEAVRDDPVAEVLARFERLGEGAPASRPTGRGPAGAR